MRECLLAWANSISLFLRSFRKACEAADRGDSVIVKGENGDYVFERRLAEKNGHRRRRAA